MERTARCHRGSSDEEEGGDDVDDPTASQHRSSSDEEEGGDDVDDPTASQHRSSSDENEDQEGGDDVHDRAAQIPSDSLSTIAIHTIVSWVLSNNKKASWHLCSEEKF